jgi:hypothetical protein
MRAIHDNFSVQIRNRLKITGMGLGLVRLLQDAGRVEEARMTLGALENGFRGDATQSDIPSNKPHTTWLGIRSRNCWNLRGRSQAIHGISSFAIVVCLIVQRFK